MMSTGAGIAAMAMAVVLLLALWIDKRFGEPRPRWHPVVWMGSYLQACGSVAVSCQPAAAFVIGAFAWCLGALVTGVVAWGLQEWLFALLARVAATPGFGLVVAAVLLVALTAWLLKCMLSWRMLHDEVGAVDAALAQSLAAGRERLSLLVSRDTAQLSASEVRESAIESLAENLNDSVVAPIFWFVLFGLPGSAIYRFANTADAMWGYRGRWEWAGKWAARADDVLSWIPARVTAVLIWAVARTYPLRGLRPEARRTPSPNSGWPMAAMALALGVQLRKPGVYCLNAPGRPALATDTSAAQKYASKVVLALLFAAPAAMLLIAWVASS